MRNLFLLFGQPIYNNLGNICNQIQRLIAGKYTPFIGYVSGLFVFCILILWGIFLRRSTTSIACVYTHCIGYIFAAVPALNFHKYTLSMGYVSEPEPNFLRVAYTPFIEYICQHFCGRHTHFIEYALRQSRLPVDCKHARFIGYISRQFPEPYFVKYTHFTGYVLRLFCTLILHPHLAKHTPYIEYIPQEARRPYVPHI